MFATLTRKSYALELVTAFLATSQVIATLALYAHWARPL